MTLKNPWLADAFPEHAKLLSVEDRSGELYGLLEWLQRQQISLCVWNGNEYVRLKDTKEDLLARFKNVDLERLRVERVQLEELIIRVRERFGVQAAD